MDIKKNKKQHLKNKTFIILPARNEEKYISKVIADCKKYCPNIIVIDDGSSDKTAILAQKSGAIVLSHVINLGKGASMKTGAEYAISLDATKIIFLDSDDQHEASKIPAFDSALDNFDCAFAYRDFKKIPFYRRVSNMIGLYMVRVMFGIPVRDVSNGFRGFRTSAYDKIKWNSANYEVETEMIVNLAVGGLTFTQIPTVVTYHEKYKGVGLSDAVITALKLFWWRLVK
jgi:glycosyltransferase involved in cell wall biosynthesis